MAKPKLSAQLKDALTKAGYENMDQVRIENVTTLRRKVGGDITDAVVEYFLKCNDNRVTGDEHVNVKLATKVAGEGEE